MPKLTNTFCLAICISLALGLASPSLMSAETKDIRAFVTTRYFHGIPYEEARAYGPAAIPALTEMLHEESLAPYWENIVGTLGYIGDPRAVEVLTSFLSDLKGEVSLNEFRAALAVPPALGHFAAKNEKALDLLTQFADRKTPQGVTVSFSFKRYSGEALEEVFGRVAIQGLGISGSSKALAFLETKKKSAPTDWQDNFAEAIEMNKRIRSQGAAEVFGHEN